LCYGVLPVGSGPLLVCIGRALNGDKLLPYYLTGLLGKPVAVLPPLVGVLFPRCISLLWFDEVILELIILGLVLLIY